MGLSIEASDQITREGNVDILGLFDDSLVRDIASGQHKLQKGEREAAIHTALSHVIENQVDLHDSEIQAGIEALVLSSVLAQHSPQHAQIAANIWARIDNPVVHNALNKLVYNNVIVEPKAREIPAKYFKNQPEPEMARNAHDAIHLYAAIGDMPEHPYRDWQQHRINCHSLDGFSSGMGARMILEVTSGKQGRKLEPNYMQPHFSAALTEILKNARDCVEAGYGRQLALGISNDLLKAPTASQAIVLLETWIACASWAVTLERDDIAVAIYEGITGATTVCAAVFDTASAQGKAAYLNLAFRLSEQRLHPGELTELPGHLARLMETVGDEDYLDDLQGAFNHSLEKKDNPIITTAGALFQHEKKIPGLRARFDKPAQASPQAGSAATGKQDAELDADDATEEFDTDEVEVAPEPAALSDIIDRLDPGLIEAIKAAKTGKGASRDAHLARRVEDVSTSLLLNLDTYLRAIFLQHDACEFLEYSDGKGPTTLAVADAFNRVANMAIESILAQASYDESVMCANIWAQVASRALENGNFALTFAIGGALGDAAIYRFIKPDSVYEDCNARVLCEQSNDLQAINARGYRQLLAEATGPVVPYSGIWLTDFTFASEKSGRLKSAAVRELLQKQTALQSRIDVEQLAPLQPDVQSVLMGEISDDATRYAASLKILPRGSAPERVFKTVDLQYYVPQKVGTRPMLQAPAEKFDFHTAAYEANPPFRISANPYEMFSRRQYADAWLARAQATGSRELYNRMSLDLDVLDAAIERACLALGKDFDGDFCVQMIQDPNTNFELAAIVMGKIGAHLKRDDPAIVYEFDEFYRIIEANAALEALINAEPLTAARLEAVEEQKATLHFQDNEEIAQGLKDRLTAERDAIMQSIMDDESLDESVQADKEEAELEVDETTESIEPPEAAQAVSYARFDIFQDHAPGLVGDIIQVANRTRSTKDRKITDEQAHAVKRRTDGCLRALYKQYHALSEQIFRTLDTADLTDKNYETAAGIMPSAEVFNRISHSVKMSALLQPDVEHSVVAMELWASLMWMSVENSDYFLAFAIYSALGSSELARIAKNYPDSRLEQLKNKFDAEVYNPEKNFKVYHEQIAANGAALVPYVPSSLGRLRFAKDADNFEAQSSIIATVNVQQARFADMPMPEVDLDFLARINSITLKKAMMPDLGVDAKGNETADDLYPVSTTLQARGATIAKVDFTEKDAKRFATPIGTAERLRNESIGTLPERETPEKSPLEMAYSQEQPFKLYQNPGFMMQALNERTSYWEGVKEPSTLRARIDADIKVLNAAIDSQIIACAKNFDADMFLMALNPEEATVPEVEDFEAFNYILESIQAQMIAAGKPLDAIDSVIDIYRLNHRLADLLSNEALYEAEQFAFYNGEINQILSLLAGKPIAACNQPMLERYQADEASMLQAIDSEAVLESLAVQVRQAADMPAQAADDMVEAAEQAVRTRLSHSVRLRRSSDAFTPEEVDTISRVQFASLRQSPLLSQVSGIPADLNVEDGSPRLVIEEDDDTDDSDEVFADIGMYDTFVPAGDETMRQQDVEAEESQYLEALAGVVAHPQTEVSPDYRQKRLDSVFELSMPQNIPEVRSLVGAHYPETDDFYADVFAARMSLEDELYILETPAWKIADTLNIAMQHSQEQVTRFTEMDAELLQFSIQGRRDEQQDRAVLQQQSDARDAMLDSIEAEPLQTTPEMLTRLNALTTALEAHTEEEDSREAVETVHVRNQQARVKTMAWMKETAKDFVPVAGQKARRQTVMDMDFSPMSTAALSQELSQRKLVRNWSVHDGVLTQAQVAQLDEDIETLMQAHAAKAKTTPRTTQASRSPFASSTELELEPKARTKLSASYGGPAVNREIKPDAPKVLIQSQAIDIDDIQDPVILANKYASKIEAKAGEVQYTTALASKSKSQHKDSPVYSKEKVLVAKMLTLAIVRQIENGTFDFDNPTITLGGHDSETLKPVAKAIAEIANINVIVNGDINEAHVKHKGKYKRMPEVKALKEMVESLKACKHNGEEPVFRPEQMGPAFVAT